MRENVKAKREVTAGKKEPASPKKKVGGFQKQNLAERNKEVKENVGWKGTKGMVGRLSRESCENCALRMILNKSSCQTLE